LVKALVNTDWLSWSPDGKKFVAVDGSGRQLTVNKSLVICDITSNSCQPVSQPDNTVSLNPAWSPDGSRIAFVRAASGQDAFNSEANYADWLKTNAIWLVNADGSNPQAVTGLDGQGFENPLWSADGKQLLVAQAAATGQDALWLATLTGENGKVQATTRLVAQPVGNPTQDASNYYAYSDWSSLVNWLNK
jgi:TolB protein